MMKHIALLAALVAATPATAGQMLVPGYAGPRYVPGPRYMGPPPAGWLAPRGPWLNGYVTPWPPVGPRYERRSDVGAIVGGALAGAALSLIPRATEALAQRLPPTQPAPQVAAMPAPEPAGDPLDAIPDASPNTARVTRQERRGARRLVLNQRGRAAVPEAHALVETQRLVREGRCRLG